MEEGRGERAVTDDGVPMTHAETAPERYSPRGFSEEDGNGTIHKEQEAKDFSNDDNNDGQQYSGETAIDPSHKPTAAGGGEGSMRNRKPESTKEAAQDEPEEKPKKEHRLFKTIHPKEPFTFRNQFQRTFLNSWINILLIAAPVGIILGAIPHMNHYAIFIVNFVAIIPLAAMLSFATEEIALRTGETLGGLLNATFGNAVELIVAIMALVKGKIVIVQTSLIGSILSNLLLVLGMCFFFGGLRRQEQYFNTTVAQTAASLLALAVGSIIVPTVFEQITDLAQSQTAALSRGTAIILLFVYAGYLYFQLKTHHAVFSEESQKVPMRPRKNELKDGAIQAGVLGPAGLMGHAVPGRSDNERLSKMLMDNPGANDAEEEGEDPQLSFAVALGTLVGVTVVIAFCAEFLVDSIDYVVREGGLSEEFLGLILLPIVGNAAEHATAVTVAIKDKMDLAIGVAVGSSMQVALFLIPLLVVIGWGMGRDDMNLAFDVFQVVVMFVSVLLVNYLIGDGKSHWLEGKLLMCLYVIIAVCAWYYPAKVE